MTGQYDVFQHAMRKGNAAAWDQQWEQAIAAYQAALSEFPDQVEALANTGWAFLQQNEPEKALQMYERTAKLAPADPIVHMRLADTLERMGRREDAAQRYVKVADIQLERRELESAITSLTRASQLAPDSLMVHSRLALVCQQANKTRPATLAYLTLARLLQDNGRQAEAVRAAQSALRLDPRNDQIEQAVEMTQKGTLLPKMQRLHGPPSQAQLAPTQELRPSSSGQRLPQRDLKSSPAGAALQLSLRTLSGFLLDQGTLDRPEDALGDVGQQETHGHRYDRTKALQHVSKAIELQGGQAGEASFELAQAIGLGVLHPAAYLNMGVLLYEFGNLAEAVPYLERSLSLPEYAMGAHFALGQAMLRLDKPGAAAGHFIEALKLADLQIVPQARADVLAKRYAAVSEGYVRTDDREAQMVMATALSDFLSGDGWQERVRYVRAQLDQLPKGAGNQPLAEFIAGTSHCLTLTWLPEVAQAGNHASQVTGFSLTVFLRQRVSKAGARKVALGLADNVAALQRLLDYEDLNNPPLWTAHLTSPWRPDELLDDPDLRLEAIKRYLFRTWERAFRLVAWYLPGIGRYRYLTHRPSIKSVEEMGLLEKHRIAGIKMREDEAEWAAIREAAHGWIYEFQGRVVSGDSVDTILRSLPLDFSNGQSDPVLTWNRQLRLTYFLYSNFLVAGQPTSGLWYFCPRHVMPDIRACLDPARLWSWLEREHTEIPPAVVARVQALSGLLARKTA